MPFTPRRRLVLSGLSSPFVGAMVRTLSAGSLATATPLALAQFKVDVSGIGATQIPVAIAAFQGEEQCPLSIVDIIEAGEASPWTAPVAPKCPQAVTGIVRADLTRSGDFRVSNLAGAALSENGPVDYAAWRSQGLAAAAGGSVVNEGPGRWAIRFRLWDVVTQRDLGGQIYRVSSPDLRLAAHHISDDIYQLLTGQRGVFATRIAYVTQAARNDFSLVVADSDGLGARQALRSRQPLMSPVWSPSGDALAYVSFETGKPVVFTQSIRTGQRRMLANFRGSNSAPAFSPDGQTVAVVLTLSGRSQIYMLSRVGNEAPRPLTSGPSIETEPTFSPDGKTVYFVSDRDGSPQIYQVAITGGGVQRLTFSGSYNVSPTISPDGRKMAYVSQRGDQYHIVVQDLGSENVQTLGVGPDDSHPSFAPNGSLLVYSTRERGLDVLKTVALNGDLRSSLQLGGRVNAREPSWGPWTPKTA